MTQLGCIADDFTGATDVAAALTSAGHRTVVTIGVPEGPVLGADAVVVALKSRTAPVAAAVEESIAAARALRALGASRFYFKYCSTFDSTPQGNIGPVADALLAELGLKLGVVVPSFPANGRRVFQGHLFVHDQPLDESPMSHHPLTPMKDANLLRLLAPQTTSRVELVPLQVVQDGTALPATLASLAGGTTRTLAVVDAVNDRDLVRIAHALPERALITGGAGLAAALAGPDRRPDPIGFPAGPRLVVAGSASAATREQIAVAAREIPSAQVDRARLATAFDEEVARLLAVVRTAERTLVYATASLDDLAADVDRARDAALIERCLAELTRAAVAAGARRIVIAGGETAGAVTAALGVRRLEIGPSIAPGVVWSSAATADGTRVALALKSGNFGGPRLFLDAWDVLG